MTDVERKLDAKQLVNGAADFREALEETADSLVELLALARRLPRSVGLDDRQVMEWVLAEAITRDGFQLDFELLSWLRDSGFEFLDEDRGTEAVALPKRPEVRP